MLRDMDRVRKVEILFIVLLGVAFLGYLIAIWCLDIETEVMRDRFWKDVEPIFHGEVPIIEYPPLSLVFFCIPRIFFSDPFSYNVGYVIMIYAITVAGLVLVRRTAEELKVNQVWTMTVYSVLIALMLEYVADRYDIIPAVMTIGAFYLLIRNRAPASFVLLGLATMTKLYPILLAPFFATKYLMNRDWKGLSLVVVWFVAGVAIVAVPAYLLDPGMITGFLGYHSARPLEIDSLAATLIYPLSMLDLTEVWIQPATAVGSYGSDNLRGPLCDAVAPLLTPIMAVLLVVLALWFWKLRSGMERVDERVFATSAAIVVALMIFILVGKVLSSQYLIWIIPFLAVALATMQDRELKWRVFWTAVIALVITQINFAYTFGVTGGGESITSLSMIMVLIRNIVLVAMTVMLIKGISDVGRDGFPGEDRNSDLDFEF